MPQDPLLLGYELLQLYQFCALHSLVLNVAFGHEAWVSRDDETVLVFDFAGQPPEADHFRMIYRDLVEKLAQEPL